MAQVADALGLDRFAAMGSSSGGSHALACAALLPDRVTGVACFAAIAPFTGDDDWFAGMANDGALRAAVAGREARARPPARSTRPTPARPSSGAPATSVSAVRFHGSEE
jgi:pimeloyl-ACP methyl ester carboxylesterase